MLHRAFFFDRDGIVNKRIVGGYVTSVDEFVFLPDFFSVFRLVKEMEYLAILVTNQQGVGKGLMTDEDLRAVHAYMQRCIRAKTGWQFDDIYAATECDRVECQQFSEGAVVHRRRKPSPTMLYEAHARWGIHFALSWMIGDSLSDAEAGRAAGVHTVLVGNFQKHEADIVVPSLQALVPLLPSLLSPQENASIISAKLYGSK
ncbi:MAG: HAD-IIIA family hydrolase [Bacteroidota bacterium]|nr:HAD-IIIA family hydrolase [Candidatus Kapabacteria bacterium]MDW8220962.1 HAD-IIIA family hydrolase [Bacteroidota bacterium]